MKEKYGRVQSVKWRTYILAIFGRSSSSKKMFLLGTHETGAWYGRLTSSAGINNLWKFVCAPVRLLGVELS